jgi:signal transduction histidine kinase
VTVEGTDLLPAFRCDPEKLAQALGNIVVNAVELVAGDGTGTVTVRGQKRGELIEFRIEDNGPGIHLEPGQDLFSPFFSRREGGTGLGLSIVQRIVAAHQGEVAHGNNDAGGAWFQVRVPLAPTNRPGQVI